ncbi:MAG: hypothetical protein UU66_C0020G0001 [Parcubacteria group bacterium GW2011_GWB1_41_5]|nr:MAG: hypothetical protein UU66_C0020G0001 [Parcubacteria group bacterium GW2011_GWB1_41_5]
MKKASPLILIAVVVLACIPLLRPGFFVSDDGGWMIIRLSAFYQSFREGQFPVRFLGRLNFGYGYPVANFLYPGFMYIGSLIHAAGASFVDTVKIILGGSVAVGTAFTYLWLRKYFKTPASVVGTIGFTLAPYLLFDIYWRGSVGEALAVSWAAMGLYSIAAKKKWLFGLALPLLILAHNSLALLFVGIFVLYITLRGLWREFGMMFFVGIGMAAFFWMPAVYERKYVVFDSIIVANPKEYFITFVLAPLLGFSGIIAGLFSLSLHKKIKEKKFFLFILGIITFLVFPVSGFFWQIPLLVRLIQFPYRLLSVAIFAGAWLAAYVVEFAPKRAGVICAFVFVGLSAWGAIGALQSVDYIHYPEGYYTTNEATTTVLDEYMPKWVSVKPSAHAPSRLQFYQGRGTILEKRTNTQMIDVVVDAAEESIIQLNTVYYPGWGATLDDVQVRLVYDNPQGVMRIEVPAGRHHLVVAFRETISRFLADSLSLICFILYIVLLFL